MNPEQQRIAIAEACGWDTGECKSGYGIPYFKGIGMGEDEEILPDYLKDLNAMHEAEKELGGPSDYRWSGYCTFLSDTVGDGGSRIHATAAQRAEAFLKTLGLWVQADEQEPLAESAPTTPNSSTKETP